MIPPFEILFHKKDNVSISGFVEFKSNDRNDIFVMSCVFILSGSNPFTILTLLFSLKLFITN